MRCARLPTRPHARRTRAARSGFTLVELLIVMAILVLLTGITVALVTSVLDGDRGRSGARLLQSALEGARSRAIHTTRSHPPAGQARGLRLMVDYPFGDQGRPNPISPGTFLDPLRSGLVTSMVFVGESERWSRGEVTVGRFMTEQNVRGRSYGTDDIVVLRGDGTGWQVLFNRGLLVNGSIVELRRTRYVVDTWFLEGNPPPDADPREILVLTPEFLNPAEFFGVPDAFSPEEEYHLHLEPAVLPNQDPIRLPQGVVIDLFYSRIPGHLLGRADRIDIMFSPRGVITGPAASAGMIHLLLSDMEDVELGNVPQAAVREQFLLTIGTQTGSVSSHPVDTLSGNLYRYAQRGEVAAQ